MATFTKRKSGWFVQVRRKGFASISRTFNSRAEGERWALGVEASMGVGVYVDDRAALAVTLADCLARYAVEIIPGKKGAARDLYRVRLWAGSVLASRGIGSIKQVDVAAWRDARLAGGAGGATVTKDLALLSHVFTIAAKEWGYPVVNPVSMIRKPKAGAGRDRRLLDGEELLLLAACGDELRAFVIVAIESAMRRGEIAGLKRAWVRGRVAYLPDTKNGSPRAVPLSRRALEAIHGLPVRADGALFGLSGEYYSKAFLAACRAAGLEDLHLHDLRHEATSRFFEKGLDVMQVKSITGHKSLQMLSRYTHLRADDLAGLLG